MFHCSVYGVFASLCFTVQCMVCLSVCVSLLSVWCVCQSVFHWSVYGVFVSLCFTVRCMVLYFTAQCMVLCLSVCVSLLSIWCCVCLFLLFYDSLVQDAETRPSLVK